MNIPRLIRTLVHLKPTQIWFQVWRRVQKKFEPHPRCGENELPEFTFLNLTVRPKGWNDSSLDMLWRYNLHYFDQGLELVPRWIRENPKGSVPGWDPYPTSLRIVNWIKGVESSRLKGEGRGEVENSLKEQLDWLEGHLEWHILANHLLANLKAMVIGRTWFGQSSEKWMALYRRQIEEQILPDGGHYERSVMYHAIILEDVLDVLHFCGAAADWLRPIAERMVRYLILMTGPDGKIVLFNDAADGIAKPTAWLVAYARRLGITVPDEPAAEVVVDFPQTGYTRLAVGDFVLYADVAPLGPDYQPGHAHADTLTYELYYKGEKVVTDVGTSEYRGTRRAYERSSAAHNVVQVDGRDSSEVWSSHRVGRRVRIVGREVLQNGANSAYVKGSVLANGVRLDRTWTLSARGLEVIEKVVGGRSCVTRVHLTPNALRNIRVEMVPIKQETYDRALEFGRVEASECLIATFDPGRDFRYNIIPRL